jgi:hypothetical protein
MKRDYIDDREEEQKKPAGGKKEFFTLSEVNNSAD